MEQNNHPARTARCRSSRPAVLRTLLTTCLLVAAYCGAQAATTYLTVGDYAVTGTVTLTSANTTARITQGTVTFNASTMTLTLDNVKIKATKGNGITVKQTDINILVKGTLNEVTTTYSSGYGIRIDGSRLLTRIWGYDSSASITLQGSSTKSGLHIGSNCGCRISNLTLSAGGRRGVDGIDGKSGERLELNAGVHLVANGTTAAIANLANITLDESLSYYKPVGGTFNTSKHGVVNSSGTLATSADIRTLVKYGLKVFGRDVTNFNCDDCDYIGTGTIKYSPDTKTLTLDGVQENTDETYFYAFVENKSVSGLRITVKGQNHIVLTEPLGFLLYQNTTIDVNGWLELRNNGVYKPVIALREVGTTLTISSSGRFYIYSLYDGIACCDRNQTVNIQGSGIVNVNSTKAACISFTGNADALNVSGSVRLSMNGYYCVSSTGDEGKVTLSTSGDIVASANMRGFDMRANKCSININGTGYYSFHSDNGCFLMEGTGNKLNIADNTDIACTASAGCVAWMLGENNAVTIEATKSLSMKATNGSLSFYSDNLSNSITFNKTTAKMMATSGIEGFGNAKFTNCDIASPDYCYYNTSATKFYNQNGALKNETIELKPVTTSYDIYFGDRQLNDVNCKAFFAEGMKSGTVSYNATSKTLTMNNVTMNWGTNNYPAFDNYGVSGLTIDLYGTNTFQNQNAADAAFRVRGTTTLRAGNATGKLVAHNTKTYDNLLITNGTSLTVKDGVTVESYGIVGNGSSTLKVENATVTLSGHNTATIQKLQALTLSNAHIESPKGATYNTTKKQLLTSGGTTVTTAVSIVPGAAKNDADVNGDGRVDKADAAALMRYIGGRTTGITKTKADVNGDGRVTVADIIAVTQAIAGK